MKLILGGINGQYLRDIFDGMQGSVEEVVAAVAYATNASLLFDWCWDNKIPLKFYGRLDEDIAVAIPVLQSFLARRSAAYTCRLVQCHHAKVIWWKGLGLYIGSANLTDSAWHSNVEAGCFFEEEEITDLMSLEIEKIFETLERNSTPLTEELFRIMRIRAFMLGKIDTGIGEFWKEPSIKKWAGLVKNSPSSALEQRRSQFLSEWHATLQDIRNIGALVSVAENRPIWVPEKAPAGAQADQFLHAHYYERTIDEHRKTQYRAHYERNKSRREEALQEAVEWWRALKHAPSNEETMLSATAPFLRNSLTAEALTAMTQEQFEGICSKVHAITDYARRVSNASVKLPGGRRYSIPEKIKALAARIWMDSTGSGAHVKEQLNHVLYGGSAEDLPTRLWAAVSDPKWKIDGLGISALGELAGWAMPDRFPPRNGRTSKALKSLGYDVVVHVE
ncbi:phospholipase D-like domain-containing protein [Bosea robiniae]|uniref:PLD-like domain-containing protein n=1 Tax=Bosea robiniae TaxID=1036780 RepID=A0ABY0NE26_9HYPH|nr:phospholipase D-like domain-containing protein [Bosea robiniae]SDF29284.1 PLD-like domain-containing protein [Bosea robiniae]